MPDCSCPIVEDATSGKPRAPWESDAVRMQHEAMASIENATDDQIVLCWLRWIMDSGSISWLVWSWVVFDFITICSIWNESHRLVHLLTNLMTNRFSAIAQGQEGKRYISCSVWRALFEWVMMSNNNKRRCTQCAVMNELESRLLPTCIRFNGRTLELSSFVY